MTFEEFYALIQKRHVGNWADKRYWNLVYNLDLEERTEEYILKELPFLAVRSIGEFQRKSLNRGILL